MKKKYKLTLQIKFWGIFFIISFSCLLILGFGIAEYNDLKIRSKELREHYVNKQKEKIKIQVENVINDIKLKKKIIRDSAKEQVKNEVYEAYKIAENLYTKYKNKKSKEEILDIIMEALRPIRFNNGNGYIFSNDLTGKVLLYPTIPAYENSNILNLKDSNGDFVVKKQNQICHEKGEGFVIGYWPKPNSKLKTGITKTSYIKYFDPFEIYFGAGIYIDEIEEIEKQEAIEQLVNTRFGKNNENYFFGSTYEGDPLFSNGEITKGGNSIWNLTDPTGIKIIQEQRKAVNNPDGGFIYYSWNKLDSEKLSPKISFTKGLDNWKWMIGAGVYVDDIEIEINKMQTVMKTRTIKQLVIISIISLITVLIFLLFLNLFYSKVNRDYNQLQTFLKDAAFSKDLIDIPNIRFKEFENMANNANKILLARNRNTQLIELIHANIPSIVWKAGIDENGNFYDTYISDVVDDFLSLTKGTINNSWEMYFSYIAPKYLPLIDEKFQYGIANPGILVSFDYELERADSTNVWFSSKGRVQIEKDKLIVYGSTIDITERKLAEEQIKNDLKIQTALIQEIYHRTKNNMAVISAMISIQSRHSENEYVKSTFREINNKIQAMSLVHQKLYKAKDLSNIDLKDYIEDLTNLISRSYSTLSERIKIKFDLQEIKILIDTAVPLGLMINELVSNVFKHAFPGNQKGEMIIRLFKEDDKTINLELIDNGIGFPQNFNPRKDCSMGLTLVFSIVEKQLKGEIFVKSENGLKWHIKIKDDTEKVRI